jgi:hypothetical protein
VLLDSFRAAFSGTWSISRWTVFNGTPDATAASLGVKETTQRRHSRPVELDLVALRCASNSIARNRSAAKFFKNDAGLAAARTGSDNASSRWTHSSARLERLPHMQEVPGSSPGASTKYSSTFSRLRIEALSRCVGGLGARRFVPRLVGGGYWRHSSNASTWRRLPIELALESCDPARSGVVANFV